MHKNGYLASRAQHLPGLQDSPLSHFHVDAVVISSFDDAFRCVISAGRHYANVQQSRRL